MPTQQNKKCPGKNFWLKYILNYYLFNRLWLIKTHQITRFRVQAMGKIFPYLSGKEDLGLWKPRRWNVSLGSSERFSLDLLNYMVDFTWTLNALWMSSGLLYPYCHLYGWSRTRKDLKQHIPETCQTAYKYFWDIYGRHPEVGTLWSPAWSVCNRESLG